MITVHRILITEDNPYVAQVLVDVLEEAGYAVSVAQDGIELLDLAQKLRPDLMLIDVLMPQMDGYETIRQIRNDTRLAHIPIVILTASSDPNDVVSGFNSGADDYIRKPFDESELLVRIAAKIRQVHRFALHNPLTGLPGNRMIEEEIRHWLRKQLDFALLYIDLDNFKALNDTYGFARGDQVIKLLARLLTEFQQQYPEQTFFAGHIGGDDFVALVAVEYAETWCQLLIEQFSVEIKHFYDSPDLQRGYVVTYDRRVTLLPQQAVSIAGVCVMHTQAWAYEELTEFIAAVKREVKQIPQSSYVLYCDSEHPIVYQNTTTTANVALLNDQQGVWKPVIYQLAYQQRWYVLEQLNDQFPCEVIFVVGTPDEHITQQLAGFDSSVVIVMLPAQFEDQLLHLIYDVRTQQPRDLESYLLFALHLKRLEGR